MQSAETKIKCENLGKMKGGIGGNLRIPGVERYLRHL